jgi:UDP-N-acetylglucosamine acyltransferase
VNLVGLKRRQFSEERQRLIRQMHKLLFRSGLTLDQARADIEALGSAQPDVRTMLDFLAASTRGLVR